jgi:cytochrome P450
MRQATVPHSVTPVQQGVAERGPVLTTVVPPTHRLGRLEMFRRLIRNPIEAWPDAVYREPYLRRQTLRMPTVFLCDPDLVRDALVDQSDAFTRTTSQARGGLKTMLGDGLLTTDGAEWRWQRRTASPVFRHDRLQGFVPSMQQAAAATLARLRALRPGQEVELGQAMMHTTFDIILDTMLSGGAGIEADRVEQAVADLIGSTGWRAVLALMRAPLWTPFPGRGRALAARHLLRGMVAEAVDRAARGASEEGGAGQEGGADLLAHLARAQDPETGQPMDRERVIDNILTFILAGHETTALALTWTFYLLAKHPQIETAARAEIAAVTGGAAVNSAHLDELALIRQIVMESMRLYPPAGAIGRIAMRDMTIGGHLDVARGTLVLIPIYAIHRHHRLWEAPEIFDPSRFTQDAGAARHRYAYLPFGGGQHTCIGMNFAIMEAMVILATILQGASLKLRPDHDPGMRLRVTLRPAHGMPMTVQPV